MELLRSIVPGFIIRLGAPKAGFTVAGAPKDQNSRTGTET